MNTWYKKILVKAKRYLKKQRRKKEIWTYIEHDYLTPKNNVIHDRFDIIIIDSLV